MENEELMDDQDQELDEEDLVVGMEVGDDIAAFAAALGTSPQAILEAFTPVNAAESQEAIPPLFNPTSPPRRISVVDDSDEEPSIPVGIMLYEDTQPRTLEELNVRNISEYWGTIREDEGAPKPFEVFREYWLKVVPHVYQLTANQDCLVPFRGVAPKADQYLLDPICLFLTGGKYTTESLSTYLAKVDQPPTVCGKVFQVGEATYSCRECGMDPTCVLCADCFKSSPHKGHKYKIATSAGGGYCDCGDVEAWRDHAHCELHKPKTEEVAPEEADQDGFKERAYMLFPNVLAYCYQMTTSESAYQLPTNFDIYEKQKEDDQQDDKNDEDTLFCTVLYNDETHTFDLVIQTLTRALGCSKKDAIEYATTIDREGRSIVKVGGIQPCQNVQNVIERHTSRASNKPLKSVVMKSYIVQHQAFAIKLLSWMETICSQSETVRIILQNILYHKDLDNARLKKWANGDPNMSGMWLIEGVLWHDTRLWKAARSCWHRLVIAGLLKEYDSKKRFSEIFAKQYVSIMNDFLHDDHDHSYSVTSLSVQIFTVPSISHYLVEKVDALYTIMRVLLAQCEQRLNTRGKLEFDRGAVVTTSFKRTNFSILDLKYILTNAPPEWSADMIKSYTHFIDSFLKLLSYMQEMDAVTRQVGQHMEYEPEWESAFNLHIKLQPVVQLSLDWCSGTNTTLVRAFRRCLTDLSKIYEDLKSTTITLELANHSATCYVYDVSSSPVSVHLPLTRYYAGLYLHLDSWDMDFFHSAFSLTSIEKPVPEMIMEPALRTQVLIAQVNAGMWKRNGYSLLNQLYFYHNVRCRGDMLDKDIITLQTAASIIESNEFLLHVINRFGLYQWVQTTFDEKSLKPTGQEEDTGKYLSMLADEFFGLIITLVSARYVHGVGDITRVDLIKKEVIQQLCIDSMTHSTLNKSLVENVNMETGLELVIKEVANLRGPTPQRTSVVYELKPEFYSDYDVYHYHYTREEMSKAEEKQRERKRAAREPEIFPPPSLPEFRRTFDMIVNLLQCDVFLHVISVVLNRTLHKTARYSSESIVRKALHLIGHGLNEEIARNKKEKLHFFQFTEQATRWKIFDLLDELLQESSASQYHEMIIWIRKQCNIIKPTVVNEPMVAQPNEDEEKRKAELGREAKRKMMEKMAAAQKNFMAVNKDLFVEEMDSEAEAADNNLVDMESKAANTIALGLKQTPCYQPEEKFICILCQEDQPLVIGSKRFVLASFVQRSTVLSQYREKLIEESTPEFQTREPIPIPPAEASDPLFINADLRSAPVMTTCGHIMHDSCWSSHIDTVFNKERRRPYRLRHPLSFDIDKNEWLCPMCDSICNAVLPMTVPLSKLYPPVAAAAAEGSDPKAKPTEESQGMDTEDSEEEHAPKPAPPTVTAPYHVWIQGIFDTVKMTCPTRDKMSTSPEFQEWASHMYDEERTVPMLTIMLTPPLSAVIKRLESKDAITFSNLYSTREVDEESAAYKWLLCGFWNKLANFMTLNYSASLGLEQNQDDFRNQLMMWNCLSFSIISAEAFNRGEGIPFFGTDVPLRKTIGIKYLTRACGVATDKKPSCIRNLQTFAARILQVLFALEQDGMPTATLMECDAFSLLVSLTFSMPAMFFDPTQKLNREEPTPDSGKPEFCVQPPQGTPSDHHILRLVYTYHIIQILVSNDFSHCLRSDEEIEQMEKAGTIKTKDEWGQEKICKIMEQVWTRLEKPNVPYQDMNRVDCDKVWSAIQEAAIPFLRCCAKFYEHLTGITPPRCMEGEQNTFDDLMNFLDLPKSFDELFDSSDAILIPFRHSVMHKAFKILQKQLPENASKYPLCDNGVYRFLPRQLPVRYPRVLGTLTPLPEDYTELINMVSNFTCKNSNTLDSRTPTMCLLCGAVFCSQSYCCQREIKPNVNVGSCMYHAIYCGGGCGIFLRIRECKLFLTSGHNRGLFTPVVRPFRDLIPLYNDEPNTNMLKLKGCYMPPPYLDEYGEIDQGLRRGNPLTLCSDKYNVFRKMWLQHSIPEEIARQTEHNSAVVTTDWQYL